MQISQPCPWRPFKEVSARTCNGVLVVSGFDSRQYWTGRILTAATPTETCEPSALRSENQMRE